ncbi:hypothetical protein AMK16_27640 [Streptomyces sp. CB00455]|uniref:hypothetical protein n=1 Tax=Streptomyces sp. CB00455 TaxID=1703927 RepID=UPI000939493C|nr:hypothetical protein [Streptomyces sp. CB00455]OKK15661.1 hypothetical protein AMK16_27640 [Streptomyces sp. CB00455]
MPSRAPALGHSGSSHHDTTTQHTRPAQPPRFQLLVHEVRQVLAAGGFADLEGDTGGGLLLREDASGVLITWQVNVRAVTDMHGRGDDKLEGLTSLPGLRQAVACALTAILEGAGPLVHPDPAGRFLVTRLR